MTSVRLNSEFFILFRCNV